MLKFNGTTDALRLPDVPGLGDYSVSCRFVAYSASSGESAVFSADNTPTSPRQICVYDVDDGTDTGHAWLRAAVDDNDAISQPAAPSINQLHWLTIRRAGSVVTFWLDGTQIGSIDVTTTATFTLPNPTIGGYPLSSGATTSFFFDGLIDRFSLWSRAWTDQEVADFVSGSDITAFADQSGLVYDLPLDSDLVDRVSGTEVAMVIGSPSFLALSGPRPRPSFLGLRPRTVG